jgi:hypothetical protein
MFKARKPCTPAATLGLPFPPAPSVIVTPFDTHPEFHSNDSGNSAFSGTTIDRRLTLLAVQNVPDLKVELKLNRARSCRPECVAQFVTHRAVPS